MSGVLVWLDMEMSGLEAAKERILEVAIILTDGQLNIIAEGPEIVIHQPPELLAAMDEWNTRTHTASGLVARVNASTTTDAEAEAAVLQAIAAHVPSGDRPVLAGNSIHQDRRFIRRYWPLLDARLHYRMVDVSTIKELARRWYPESLGGLPPKGEAHRALQDVRDSIEELRFYRSALFRAPAVADAAAPGQP